MNFFILFCIFYFNDKLNNVVQDKLLVMQVLVLKEKTPQIIDNILYKSVYFKLFFVNIQKKTNCFREEEKKKYRVYQAKGN